MELKKIFKLKKDIKAQLDLVKSINQHLINTSTQTTMLSRFTHLAKRVALTSNKSTSMKVAKRSLISDLSTNMRLTGNDGYEIKPDVDPMLLRDLKREMNNNEEKDSSNIKANEEAPEDHWEDYIDPKIKQKVSENKSKVTLDFH